MKTLVPMFIGALLVYLGILAGRIPRRRRTDLPVLAPNEEIDFRGPQEKVVTCLVTEIQWDGGKTFVRLQDKRSYVVEHSTDWMG